MPRQKEARRFDARHHCISATTMETEAQALVREVQDYAVLSGAEFNNQRAERHALTEQTWQHLVLLLGDLPERDRRVIQTLLFRDLYFVVELYRTYLKGNRLE